MAELTKEELDKIIADNKAIIASIKDPKKKASDKAIRDKAVAEGRALTPQELLQLNYRTGDEGTQVTLQEFGAGPQGTVYNPTATGEAAEKKPDNQEALRFRIYQEYLRQWNYGKRDYTTKELYQQGVEPMTFEEFKPAFLAVGENQNRINELASFSKGQGELAVRTGGKQVPGMDLLLDPRYGATVDSVIAGASGKPATTQNVSGATPVTTPGFPDRGTPVTAPGFPDSNTPVTTQSIPSGMTATQYNERMGVYATMADRFNKYGLTGLADKIKELAVKGATEATITLELQDTPDYQQRFAANADRIKKGLRALTPAEYVNVEDSYRQVLRAYGLKQFDNDAYVKQFIANDISPTEMSNRVSTAVQRVQNADPAIVKQLKDYYGIGDKDMVAYVLDPEQQFQKIERQVAAAEIGVAAARQGLTAGVSVAEQLAAQGVSEAEARKGYATIADILPTAEKLSDIYGSTLDEYRQSEGEQEVFNSLASAQRKRQALTARELAAFSGSSGTNKASLTQTNVGQF